jgi:hypothetical protein
MAEDKSVNLTEDYQPLKRGYQPVGGALNPTAPSSGSGISVAVIPSTPPAPAPASSGDSAQSDKK